MLDTLKLTILTLMDLVSQGAAFPDTCSLGAGRVISGQRSPPGCLLCFSLVSGPSQWPDRESNHDIVWGALGCSVPHHLHPSLEKTGSMTPSIFWGSRWRQRAPNLIKVPWLAWGQAATVPSSGATCQLSPAQVTSGGDMLACFSVSHLREAL